MKAHSDFHDVRGGVHQPIAQATAASALRLLGAVSALVHALLPKKRRNVSKEHAALTEAALAHNADAVVDQLAHHIQTTTDRLLEGNAGRDD